MPNNSKKEPPLNCDDYGLKSAKGQVLVYQAEGEYDKFHTNRMTESSKQISNFDKAVKQIESSKKKGGTTNGH